MSNLIRNRRDLFKNESSDFILDSIYQSKTELDFQTTDSNMDIEHRSLHSETSADIINNQSGSNRKSYDKLEFKES
ncbi:hypothetical protein AYI69_g401 [Smittium culicis]|uniref:Uncharacterized protein n=1 Tax=Smittium culicis TaxID=133412 RepID=A0A1R1YT55_9FUNG|nr:hypothetical protein AYI69_g401 [Smittium culicis]